MSGTKIGGIKARETNYREHGKDFYRNIGKIGGSNGHTGGFAANPELARTAGAKGGRKSRRGSALQYDADWKKVKHVVIEMLKKGESLAEISRFTGIKYCVLRYRVEKGLENL